MSDTAQCDHQHMDNGDGKDHSCNFQDFPVEIIKLIVKYSAKKYPWLFVCKRSFTEIISLFNGLINDQQSNHPVNTLAKAFQHVLNKERNHDSSSDEKNGHPVKLEFLKIIKSLDLTTEGISAISRKAKSTDVHQLVQAFERCHSQDIVVFPGLKHLTFDISGTKIQDPLFMLKLVKSITNVSQPEYFCWTYDYPLWYHFKGKTPVHGLPTDLNELRLTFANGHLPKVVIHHIKAKPNTAIFPVYGTLNRFDFCYRAKVWGVMKLDDCVQFFTQILRPHITDTGDSTNLKNATKYQFQSFCSAWLWIPDEPSVKKKAEILTNRLIEVYPSLRGRLEFLEVGMEHHQSMPCQGCGRTMSAYMTLIMNNFTWKKVDMGPNEDPDNPWMMGFMTGPKTK
ncbi:uncharacterized protein I303_103765 [Kwoniella dejecticola CBS 10117]|uniref:Uncharacterized protein n=1 Tax=Kwoniella dejecticola CBS 10117 TaxID=1296121 RepID=A0A1A6A7M8_9TREE|nr:uncharacterized protein I303_03783 [Kwoniella dejecticola CBS 10117]OBR86065.1 hypothetical protein I303_03783 [Kwoniella dejecticola CBS 10117]